MHKQPVTTTTEQTTPTTVHTNLSFNPLFWRLSFLLCSCLLLRKHLKRLFARLVLLRSFALSFTLFRSPCTPSSTPPLTIGVMSEENGWLLPMALDSVVHNLSIHLHRPFPSTSPLLSRITTSSPKQPDRYLNTPIIKLRKQTLQRKLLQRILITRIIVQSYIISDAYI